MRSIEERNKLVEEHLELAEGLARKKHRAVHKTIQLFELVSAAYMGLVDAADRYETHKVHADAKRPFETYATWRIQGEMNDFLREWAWGTRDEPEYMGSIDRPISSGDDPESRETRWLRDLIVASDLLPFDELNGPELFDKLIRGLTPKVKRIFQLRFLENMTMKEVADAVEVSESRVSQILSHETQYLRRVWTDREDELWEELPTG